MNAMAITSSFSRLWHRLRAAFSGVGQSAQSSVSMVLPVRTGSAEFARTRNTPAHVLGFDQALLWATVALLVFGLVMVYSASIAMPDNPKFARYAHTHFLTRHVISLVVAFIAALIAFQIPMQTWEKWAPWLFVLSLILLIEIGRAHV